MHQVRRRCPAKVNLYLQVTGRRADGYHELVTVMQPLSLADELLVTRGAPGWRLSCDHPELPLGEENLVWRAARLFQAEWGRELGVDVSLLKRIPVAAGLGGGSSDAAGALLALNALSGGPLDAAALHRLACRLGADVPFFLRGGPAVGRGIGTELTPITLPPYWYLLINPGVPLSTPWVYENLDLPALQRRGGASVAAWDPQHPEQWVANDLETVTLKAFPELKALLDTLGRLGAQARGMSGSGPTLFGLFSSRAAALAAGGELRRTFGGWLAVARGLTGQETAPTWENSTWMV